MGKFDIDGMLRRIGLVSQPDPQRMRAMLAARRQMVDQQLLGDGSSVLRPRSAGTAHVVQDPALLRDIGQDESIVRRFEALIRSNDAGEVQRAAQGARDIIADGAHGVFSPTPTATPVGVVSYSAGNRPTRRHEVMHAYGEAARRGYPGLPLSSRLVGSLKNSSIGYPFGRVMDEVVAQRVGGRSFFDTDWDAYATQYGLEGDLAAQKLALALELLSEGGHRMAARPVLAGLGAGGAGLLGAAALSGDSED